jgi:AcrR family transcriptional regulator
MDTRLRSDALENRERILKVAVAELTRHPDVALSAIAKKAGVGQATFYRNFPSREALVIEIYRYEMEQVANLAGELLRTRPPEQALREWMDGLAQYAVTKAGLPDAIRQAASDRACPGTSSGYASVPAAAQLLLDANHKAGTIRLGVTVDDFFLATAGIWQIDPRGDWQPRLARLMDLVMDGLRVDAPGSKEPKSKSGRRPRLLR